MTLSVNGQNAHGIISNEKVIYYRRKVRLVLVPLTYLFSVLFYVSVCELAWIVNNSVVGCLKIYKNSCIYQKMFLN